MPAKTLVVLGTSSSVGKSLLVTGLCHLFARRGVRVAPYKAQNMSNNAAVCPDGLEIGRAQATQALAAGLEPHVDMNPVLIKPEADARSQVVVMGKAWKTLSARDYYPQKHILWEAATSALDRLREQYDLVIVEGAGSAAELNLKKGDIVNMAIARYANAPVLLAGDIDRGGIFAQLIGTVWLLEPEERALVKGLLVNKFRGDITLFEDGVQILEEKSNTPVLGVLPYLHDLFIPEEDAVALENPFDTPVILPNEIEIAVIRLPRIANFDDFDPLAAEDGIRIRYVDSAETLGQPAAIIIPGTKSTLRDLAWLRSLGLGDAIQHLAAKGTPAVGICGGYQMLGETIHDPEHVESTEDSAPGLSLLPIETVFAGKKATHQASAEVKKGAGWLSDLEGQTINGYEIHMGRTQSKSPWLEINERNGEAVQVLDGASSEDGKIWGCYVHGLFANEKLRRAWLKSLGWKEDSAGEKDPFAESLTRLADTLEETLDMELLEKIIWES
ncbi:MAG: cobyric acid synthase [Anaerolineae bacterium]|nr:cobyric acid synthase [Anaerolineae bacterium]MBT4459754.1 cobyric acid synthase [Anaerolineae bacterium]MBT6061252.1 cobyric acid synthase [Anaerolineae bacterium]MBT6811638.1 cobyric acid synthase [Anaerolineae bacterium]MBT7773753.1 cobyric acid synthase [Anaerolineae bacterium]